MIRLVASFGLFAVGFGSLAGLRMAGASPADKELETVQETPVAAPVATTAGPRFLSTESLEEGHPFRALETLRARQEGLESESERIQQEREATRDELQHMQKEAKQAAQELQKAGVEEARAYLTAQQVHLLTMADEGLGEQMTADLHGLRLDLEVLLPAEQVTANGTALAELSQSLAGEILERSGVPDVEAHRSLHKTLKRSAQTARQLIEERVLRPGQESVDRLPGHQKRLGPEHDKRMDWVVQSVEETRQQVRERIECAVRRAREDFEKQLQRRLRNMDVPAPGETRAALEDVAGQLEAWTERFIRGTHAALESYRSDLGTRSAVLGPALQAHLEASTDGITELEKSLQACVNESLAGAIPIDDDWRSRDQARQQIARLEQGLRRAIGQGRNAMRSASLGTMRALEDEEVIAEHAWSDLRTALRSLHQEASNDCWKLDGPHLDGRYPRRSTESELKDHVASLVE